MPKTIVVKVIGDPQAMEGQGVQQGIEDPEMKEMLDGVLRKIHQVESSIYDLEGLKDAVPMARCYAKNVSEPGQPGIIILEDLADRNGVVLPAINWGSGLTTGQLEEIVGTLANLHAWSVNNTNWRDSIETLKEFNALAGMVDHFASTFEESKKAFPDAFQKLDEKKVKEYINTDKHTEVFGVDPKASYNLPMVLVHGDVHIMNMVFQKDSNGQAGEKLVALIDWQISHQGCQMEDMARVYAMCLSTEQRRQEGDKILQRYVQLFNEKVNDSANRVKFEDCKRALDDMFAYNAVMWNCVVPLITVKDEKKQIPEEKREGFTQHMLDYFFSSLKDAVKILGW